MSVLSERMRTQSEAVSTPPGTPDPSGRKAPIPGSPSLSGSRPKLTDSKANLAGHKSEVPNGKMAEKKEEEKKLIEAEKMETERVIFYCV